MLILGNEDIEKLLTVEIAFSALERAYRSQAEGGAVNRPRSDLYLPGIHEGSVYAFKTMEGGLVESRVVALRLNSDVIQWENRGDRVVKDKVPKAPGNKWVGLIQLFSAETGEPLAMFPDGVVQVGSDWIFEEYAGGRGVGSVGLEDKMPTPPTEEERKSILDLFR